MTSSQPNLTRFAWLSIAAAVTTIAMKTAAWWLTGSVGLLSDAAESVVNLMAAAMTLMMLTVAARPPDEDHEWGHSKAEYFASAVEGLLILVAAAAIAWTADRPAAPPEGDRAGGARPRDLDRRVRRELRASPASCSRRGSSTTPSRWRPTRTT